MIMSWSLFKTFFNLGFDHIVNMSAYDHILFVIVLCAVYSWRDWKRILVLVTAFTIGHSLTLALSSLGILNIDSDLVEFLIAVTILITAVFNITMKHDTSRMIWLNYFLALFFGCIHGLGYSGKLKPLLSEDESIVPTLFSFNVGVEVGQIVIVMFIFLANYIAVEKMGIKQKSWTIFFSGAAAGVAILLMKETAFW